MVMRTITAQQARKEPLEKKGPVPHARARDPDRAAEIWTEHLNESFVIWREKSGNAGELADFPFF